MTVATTRRVSWPYAVIITLIWAVLGSVIATGTWAIITALLELRRGVSLGWLPPAFVAGLFFGGFVALLSLVPYWALLLAYATVFARRPEIEKSRRRFLTVALGLALPVAIVVFLEFLDPGSPFGAFWGPALLAGPAALVSTWIGIASPRLLIPSLRPGTWWVAA